MIVRFTCGNCGRTWVFDSKTINPAEFSCPFKRIGGCRMPHIKSLVIKHNSKALAGKSHERQAESIEQALRDVAKDVREGDLEVPFTLEFEGPGGAQYSITVDTPEASEEIAAQGFMF